MAIPPQPPAESPPPPQASKKPAPDSQPPHSRAMRSPRHPPLASEEVPPRHQSPLSYEDEALDLPLYRPPPGLTLSLKPASGLTLSFNRPSSASATSIHRPSSGSASSLHGTHGDSALSLHRLPGNSAPSLHRTVCDSPLSLHRLPPPNTSSLPRDLEYNILLRLPPDEPSHLARLRVVCRDWCRLLQSREFFRSYRVFHRLPLLLGYVFNTLGEDDRDTVRFVPTTAVSLATVDHVDVNVLDVRHGRVLFHTLFSNEINPEMIVWNPTSNARRQLPFPDFPFGSWNATPLCGADPTCNHSDCQEGRFYIAFVGSYRGTVRAALYCSDTGGWGRLASIDDGTRIARVPSAVVNNHVYMLSALSNGMILDYDYTMSRISLQRPPSLENGDSRYSDFVLFPAGNGDLRLAALHSASIFIWDLNLRADGSRSHWSPLRSIDLQSRTPIALADPSNISIVGSAADLDMIYYCTDHLIIFSFHLLSGRVEELHETVGNHRLLPYISFNPPADSGQLLQFSGERALED